jgi:hypothetical protein
MLADSFWLFTSCNGSSTFTLLNTIPWCISHDARDEYQQALVSLCNLPIPQERRHKWQWELQDTWQSFLSPLGSSWKSSRETNSFFRILYLPKSYSLAAQHLRRWCSGNMKPFQGLASGSIPERRISFCFCFVNHFYCCSSLFDDVLSGNNLDKLIWCVPVFPSSHLENLTQQLSFDRCIWESLVTFSCRSVHALVREMQRLKPIVNHSSPHRKHHQSQNQKEIFE